MSTETQIAELRLRAWKETEDYALALYLSGNDAHCALRLGFLTGWTDSNNGAPPTPNPYICPVCNRPIQNTDETYYQLVHVGCCEKKPSAKKQWTAKEYGLRRTEQCVSCNVWVSDWVDTEESTGRICRPCEWNAELREQLRLATERAEEAERKSNMKRLIEGAKWRPGNGPISQEEALSKLMAAEHEILSLRSMIAKKDEALRIVRIRFVGQREYRGEFEQVEAALALTPSPAKEPDLNAGLLDPVPARE